MRFNLLEKPLLARVVIDIAPDHTRRVYASKFDAKNQAEVAKLIEAVICGAIDLAQKHGIEIKGFEVKRGDPA